MDFLFNILIEPWITILTAPLFFGEVVIGGILSGVMYSLVALGFVLIYKASGVFNFAQGVMVLFAALSLVGLMERGVPLLLAIVLTGLIMLALAFAIERVILRYMVNQEQIILFMATIGLTFFLEGFGQTLWGSNVKALDIGIPDAPLNITKVTIGTPLLSAAFAAAAAASLAILVMWRARAARRAIEELGDLRCRCYRAQRGWPRSCLGSSSSSPALPSAPMPPSSWASRARRRCSWRACHGRGSPWSCALSSSALAAWLGRRQALRDAGSLAPPLHYGWFIALGVVSTIAAAAGSCGPSEAAS